MLKRRCDDASKKEKLLSVRKRQDLQAGKLERKGCNGIDYRRVEVEVQHRPVYSKMPVVLVEQLLRLPLALA